MPTKLGAHVLRAAPDLYEYIQACPAVVKFVHDWEMAVDVPSGILVIGARVRGYDAQVQMSSGVSPYEAAEQFFQGQRQMYQASSIKYWEGPTVTGRYDKPALNTEEDVEWYAWFEVERMRLMADLGLRCVIGNFASGSPELDLWPAFLPALQAAKRYEAILGLHEYSCPWMWWMTGKHQLDPEEDQGDEGWTTLRYRKVYRQHLIPNGLRDVPLVITECGIDPLVRPKPPGAPSGTWKQLGSFWAEHDKEPDNADYYFRQLVWYDKELQKDDYVIGAAIFTWGNFGPPGSDFDVAGTGVAWRLSAYTLEDPARPFVYPTGGDVRGAPLFEEAGAIAEAEAGVHFDKGVHFDMIGEFGAEAGEAEEGVLGVEFEDTAFGLEVAEPAEPEPEQRPVEFEDTAFGLEAGVLEFEEEIAEAAEEADKQHLEEPAPRYANVDLVDHTTATRCDPVGPLAVETKYHLRINIGKLRRTSVVKDAEKYPIRTDLIESKRSDKGYWLDVIVTSEEFRVEREQHALFLPDEGESWVCECERDIEHHCGPNEREEYLYVPVASPATAGEATLRIGFYYENNLLQCHLFTAQVEVEVAGKPGYESEVDYTLTGALTNVDRLPTRTLSIFTNENADGSHRVILVGGEGSDDGREYVHHRPLSEVQIRGLLEEARKELHDTHRELIRPAKINKRTGEVILKAEYKLLLKTIGGVTNAKNRKDFVADLQKLARLGSLLWVALFHGQGDSRRVLRDMLKERATIQIGRAKDNGSPLLFPWGLIYDIHLDLLAPTQWHPCKLLEGWKPGKPLVSPGVTRCPHDDGKNHRKNVICPFGFWGLKHVLEQPLSMPEGRDLPLEITLSDGQPEMAVGFSQDLYKPQVHITELTKQLSKKARVLAKDSKDDILEMLGKTDLEFVYFFCHGRREKLPGTELWLPYLEVGDNEPITPADLMSWQDDLPADHWQKTSPLVFINGCHTAELTPDALADFVSGFVDANASGVIGTEVTVSQDLASEAALLFFSYLLEESGTVGQAIQRMRFDFLSRGNLMGLAYTPYCSADLHLKR